jgi:iron complex transport system ATP-binding protein
MTPLLNATGLAISGRLQPVDLVLAPGMTAVIGPNGAGKTSLLRALAGIELETGNVLIAGEDLAEAPPPRRMRLLSFLPATRNMVWPICARDVIALGLPSPDTPRLEELLRELELEALANRRWTISRPASGRECCWPARSPLGRVFFCSTSPSRTWIPTGFFGRCRSWPLK